MALRLTLIVALAFGILAGPGRRGLDAPVEDFEVHPAADRAGTLRLLGRAFYVVEAL